MKKLVLSVISFLFYIVCHAAATNGDTVVVQTFTFGSPQNAWFVFPSDTVSFEKILMQYTLKCNPGQNPNCGEWDYLTNTYLYKYRPQLDSSLVHQPGFTVNGAAPDSLLFMNTPSYSYHASWNYFIVHTGSTSLNSYTVNTGVTPDHYPFGATAPVSRCQYLWKASELTAAGMSAGDITGIQFNFQSIGSELKNLTIRFKATTLDSLTAAGLVNTGQTTVYSSNTQFVPTGSGWDNVQFTTPFHWDGTSNLIVEISYDNTQGGIDNIVYSGTTAFKSALLNAGSDRVAKFHSNGYLDVPVNNQLAAIDSFITVCFWAYGDSLLQPMDGTIFEGVDSLDNRIINMHCPWSDNNVFWDAGNVNGSYDRVNATATAVQEKGKWNYWTVTKNCNTHLMRIFLNGNVFINGSFRPKIMSGINRFRIGQGNWAGSKTYEGRIDDFAVFNTDIPQVMVKKLMNKKVDATHPYYSNLILNYHFDDGNYITAADSSPTQHAPAFYNGGVDNPLKSSSDLVYNFTESFTRPDIIFEQGIYTSHLDSTLVVDSVVNTPLQVVVYDQSINNQGMPTDTLLVWPAYYNHYLYDASGNVIDSTFVTPDQTLYQSYYDYYKTERKIDRFELSRFITPYGNGLSLGNGFTWTYDLSDYRTLLADSVHLSAGNWQELMDMKFLMIKGIPPRNIIDIKNIYTGNFDYGDPSRPIDDSLLLPVTSYIPPSAVTARWKSRVTGHGMDSPEDCAEFCPKMHYYKVDNVQRYAKQVWRNNCGLNPVYPQGGTWIYERSNWCPGAEVWTYDWELTNWITPGDSIVLDHDVQAYSHTTGWDYYQIEDQLVSYGAPNFTLDAAITDILAPGNNQMWARMNPVCSAPVIVIKNTGSTALTSLQITFGLNGVAPSVYNWTGNLAFMDTTIVTLPNFNWGANATSFYAYVSNPNGSSDQYAWNDTMKTVFSYPPSMPSKFVISLTTNSSPSEDHYTLMDDAGNTVLSRNNLTANTLYSDTIVLSNGCYKFDLRDDGEDGLQWWANPGQGAGSLRFIDPSNGAVINNFNPDFGSQIYQQFTVGLATGVDYILTQKNTLSVYPNPGLNGHITIDFNLTERQDATIEVVDMMGKIIVEKSFEMVTAASLQPELSRLKSGVYFVTLITKDQRITKKLLID